MKIYFIGIGGVAISGVASIYKKQGHSVAGSDMENSETLESLRKQKIKIFIGHRKKNLWVFSSKASSKPDLDFVVYSEAVPQNNIELQTALSFNIPCYSGAEALSRIVAPYYLIAVSGMHGKSTTSSMMVNVLKTARLNPSFLIGIKNGWGVGNSKYFVLEADEYQAKFLHYYPDMLILTNIEKEHLDYFKNFQKIKKIFWKYLTQVKKVIIANADDKGIRSVLTGNKKFSSLLRAKIIFYSLKDKQVSLIKKNLMIPGMHNVSNALGVLKAVRYLGITQKTALKGIKQYKGIWRRFEEKKIKIKDSAINIISDYAHHPSEIKATLQALNEKYPYEKILIIFQPHQYQRTYYLKNDFIKIFKEIRKNFPNQDVIITDIYSVKGRESKTIKQRISSKQLVKKINEENVDYYPFPQIIFYVLKSFQKKDYKVLVFMGAGNIHNLFQLFVKNYPHLKIDD